MGQSSHCLFHGKTLSWNDLTPRKGPKGRTNRVRSQIDEDIKLAKIKIMKRMKTETAQTLSDIKVNVDAAVKDITFALNELVASGEIVKGEFDYQLPGTDVEVRERRKRLVYEAIKNSPTPITHSRLGAITGLYRWPLSIILNDLLNAHRGKILSQKYGKAIAYSVCPENRL